MNALVMNEYSFFTCSKKTYISGNENFALYSYKLVTESFVGKVRKAASKKIKAINHCKYQRQGHS